MFAIFTRVAHFLAESRTRPGYATVPRNLLEDAGARSGSDPCQARELRRAALAYLRVVR